MKKLELVFCHGTLCKKMTRASVSCSIYKSFVFVNTKGGSMLWIIYVQNYV